jgi:hypothetical protein
VPAGKPSLKCGKQPARKGGWAHQAGLADATMPEIGKQADEGRFFATMQDLKAQWAIESDSS